MSLAIGERYYFMTHAYHHLIGEVVEITGKRECVLKNVVRVQHCARNWTEFFANGCKDDTNYTIWPDGTEVSGWFIKVPWNHPIPNS